MTTELVPWKLKEVGYQVWSRLRLTHTEGMHLDADGRVWWKLMSGPSLKEANRAVELARDTLGGVDTFIEVIEVDEVVS